MDYDVFRMHAVRRLTTIGRFRVTKPTQTSVAAYREIQRGSPPSITQHFSPPARADRDPFVGVGQRGLARYRGSRSARVAAGAVHSTENDGGTDMQHQL